MKKGNIKVSRKEEKCFDTYNNMIKKEFVKTAKSHGALMGGAADIMAGMPLQIGSIKSQQKTQQKLTDLNTVYQMTTGSDLIQDLSKYQKPRGGGILRSIGLIGGTLAGAALGGKVGGTIATKFMKDVPAKKITSKLIGAETTKQFGEIAGSSIGSNVASFTDTAIDKKSINRAKRNLAKDTNIDPVKKDLLNKALDLQRESARKYDVVDTIDLFSSPIIQSTTSKLVRRFK